MARRHLLVGLCLCLAGCGSHTGQGVFPAVTGKVVDKSGNAVSGATARVAGTTLTATTGADGTFGIGSVPAGSYTVSAELSNGGRPSHGDSLLFRYDGRNPVDVGTITLASLTDTTGLGEVTGRVYDTSGNAVANANVELRSGSNAKTTTTGPTGAYAFRSVAPGTWQVTATVGNRSGTRSGITIGDAFTARLAQGQDVMVASSAQRGVVEGHVFDAQDRPLAGARVAVDLGGGGSVLTSYLALTDVTGYYRLADVPTRSGGRPITCSLAGYINGTDTVTVAGGGNATIDFHLSTGVDQVEQAPTPIAALAVTWPTGGTAARAAAADAARRARLGGRLAGFGRLAPTGSRIEVVVRFTPNPLSDTAGAVLYRSLDQVGLDRFLAVARTASPLTERLTDEDNALSVATRYYYRLTTLGAHGQESLRSAPLTTAPLEALGLTAPKQQATGQPLTGLPFTWTVVAGAHSYQVTLFDGDPAAGGSVVTTSPATQATSWTYTGAALAATKTYFWSVVAYDTLDPAQATAESLSAVRSFSTASS